MPENIITIDAKGKVTVERTAVVFEGDVAALDSERVAIEDKVADYDRRIAEIEALRAPLVAMLADRTALKAEILTKAELEGKVLTETKIDLEPVVEEVA